MILTKEAPSILDGRIMKRRESLSSSAESWSFPLICGLFDPSLRDYTDLLG